MNVRISFDITVSNSGDKGKYIHIPRIMIIMLDNIRIALEIKIIFDLF